MGLEGRDIIQTKTGYKYKDTRKAVSKKDMKRIHSLGIPPSYKKLRLSKGINDKVQAISIDNKQRRQYTYHPRHTRLAETHKYTRLSLFLQKQKGFWSQVKKDSQNDCERKKVIAYMFLIMKQTHIRVGNRKYCRANDSYGLTTLTKKHVRFKKDQMHIRFKGKSGIKHTFVISNTHIIQFMKKLSKCCLELFFKTKDFSILSEDLNQYLQSIIGKDFTCKDFRTLSANRYFIKSLRKNKDSSSIKKNISNAYTYSAEKLGHKKSVSKSSYVLSKIAEEYISNPSCVHKGSTVDKVLSYFLKKYFLRS